MYLKSSLPPSPDDRLLASMLRTDLVAHRQNTFEESYVHKPACTFLTNNSKPDGETYTEAAYRKSIERST